MWRSVAFTPGRRLIFRRSCSIFMANRFRISSNKIRRLEELNLPAARLLPHAGLPATLFQQDKVQVSTEEMFAIYKAMSEVSNDPAIGLKLGTEERAERYDPIAMAALCTRSLRDALQRLARYKQLTCPEKIEVIENGDECAVRFDWLLAQEQEPSALVDTCFAWIVSIARRGAGKPLHPKRVEYRRPLAHRDVYENYFRCPVKFRAPQNLLVFHKQDLDTPLTTYNAELLAIVAPQLEAELTRHLAERTTSDQAKGVLKRLLAGQRPGLQDVARELHLSTRTLQRRLTDEGVSFQQVMKEARQELAHHYLLHSSLELTETAYLLGYEDASSFFRAFHSWEGTSPGEWRSSRVTSAA
jgi:AraC-like DNA-binding protein